MSSRGDEDAATSRENASEARRRDPVEGRVNEHELKASVLTAPGQTLRCLEYGRKPEPGAVGWRALIGGGYDLGEYESGMYCAECAEREFGPAVSPRRAPPDPPSSQHVHFAPPSAEPSERPSVVITSPPQKRAGERWTIFTAIAVLAAEALWLAAIVIAVAWLVRMF
jgi:hypothetical protein